MGLLVGKAVLEALSQKRVTVIGLGGVGSWAAEALVRSGLLHITIVDGDTVCAANINRQIQALPCTVGQPQAEALKARLLEINPRCEVTAINRVFSREAITSAEAAPTQAAPAQEVPAQTDFFGIEGADYVIDAIDSLPNKIDLIEFVTKAALAYSPDPQLRPDCPAPRPVLFSSMGMASRLDPTLLKTADIWDSSGCPLARAVRQGLRKRGFTGRFTVVYSSEAPYGKIHGSAVPVTAAAGMILASLVIRDLCNG
jgi:tRNA A37 threonylcarbamoyladenosine dehydratase